MEPITIALICAASFGAVVALSAFIRQLMLSRDKNLNDEAQRRAITQEAGELEKLRDQMQNNRRFDSHYKVLGANKDAILYLDTKIEEILHKKTDLIARYGQITEKASGEVISGKISLERKDAHDRLKAKIDEEIKFYDSELVGLQKRRTSLWDTHSGLQEYLLAQEKSRNQSLDALYKQHSGVLEKVFIRHTDDSELVAKESIIAGTASFKTIIMAPLQFLLQYFNISTGISIGQAAVEENARADVEQVEDDINQPADDYKIQDEILGSQMDTARQTHSRLTIA
ncbi:MAG: hypothetical protein PSV35_02655 [bacterium]|nr:hypothetical protein [bacterium]